MGLFNDADELGKRVQEGQEAKKIEEQRKEEAKEQAKKEIDQHEENKKQGMI